MSTICGPAPHENPDGTSLSPLYAHDIYMIPRYRDNYIMRRTEGYRTGR